jgi:hypothetical protein
MERQWTETLTSHHGYSKNWTNEIGIGIEKEQTEWFMEAACGLELSSPAGFSGGKLADFLQCVDAEYLAGARLPWLALRMCSPGCKER